jgi:hypothetical protein
MRDREASRGYSPEAEEFRRVHLEHRASAWLDAMASAGVGYASTPPCRRPRLGRLRRAPFPAPSLATPDSSAPAQPSVSGPHPLTPVSAAAPGLGPAPLFRPRLRPSAAAASDAPGAASRPKSSDRRSPPLSAPTVAASHSAAAGPVRHLAYLRVRISDIADAVDAHSHAVGPAAVGPAGTDPTGRRRLLVRTRSSCCEANPAIRHADVSYAGGVVCGGRLPLADLFRGPVVPASVRFDSAKRQRRR